MEETMRRVRLRARNGEDAVSESYQMLLKQKHDDAFSGAKAVLDSGNTHYDVPVMHVTTDADFKTNDEVLNTIIKDLFSFFQ